MKAPGVDFRKSASLTDRLKALPAYMRLAVSTLFFNALRIGLFPLMQSQASHRADPIKQIVILGFGGAGNHLMLIPAIEMIRRTLPEASVHVIAASSPAAELLKGGAIVDSVTVYDARPPRNLNKYIAWVRILRSLKPDVLIGAAGLDPVFVGIVSFMSGARLRVGANWRGRGFLLTHSVELDGNEYEATLNLRQVEALLGRQPHKACDVQRFHLDDICLAEGGQWKKSLSLKPGEILVGLHPGSGSEQKWKRWGLKRFADLAHEMEIKYQCHGVFFLGPDEAELEKALLGLNIPATRISREDHSILRTASRIAQCRLFIANDSGLRQIAASLGVPSIGIFGPTSTKKNFAANGIHRALTAEHVLCRPCHYTRWWLACGMDRRCLTDITVEHVMTQVDLCIRNDLKKDG